MRYFTKELSSRMNSCDESVRVQAEYEWKQNMRRYEDELEKVKKHLSSFFFKEYMQRQEFHDCYIEKISFLRERDKYRCEIYLYDGVENFYLTLLDVKRIQLGVISLENCVAGKLAWVYSELEWTNKRTILLSIDCGPENELQFECKEIKFSMMSKRSPRCNSFRKHKTLFGK